MSPIRKCVAALTARPWKLDLTEMVIVFALFMNISVAALVIGGGK